MATKTTAKKSTKSTAKAPAKASEKKAKKVLHVGGVGLYEEVHPENHVITGKYKVFYTLFAITTVIFAATTVLLFYFAADVMSEYESIKSCARTGNYSQCVESSDDDSANDATTTDSKDGDEE